jgi:hypothetical protein
MSTTWNVCSKADGLGCVVQDQRRRVEHAQITHPWTPIQYIVKAGYVLSQTDEQQRYKKKEIPAERPDQAFGITEIILAPHPAYSIWADQQSTEKVGEDKPMPHILIEGDKGQRNHSG